MVRRPHVTESVGEREKERGDGERQVCARRVMYA